MPGHCWLESVSLPAIPINQEVQWPSLQDDLRGMDVDSVCCSTCWDSLTKELFHSLLDMEGCSFVGDKVGDKIGWEVTYYVFPAIHICRTQHRVERNYYLDNPVSLTGSQENKRWQLKACFYFITLWVCPCSLYKHCTLYINMEKELVTGSASETKS